MPVESCLLFYTHAFSSSKTKDYQTIYNEIIDNSPVAATAGNKKMGKVRDPYTDKVRAKNSILLLMNSKDHSSRSEQSQEVNWKGLI